MGENWRNNPRGCSSDGCALPHEARGYCKKHYRRLVRNGAPVLRDKSDPLSRFLPKVRRVNDCLLWQAQLDEHKYGRFFDGTKGRPAHRFYYETMRGEVPKDLELDHLCRVPHCVNPDHLEPVTHRENDIRGVEARKGDRPLCSAGHFLDMTGDPVVGRCMACADLAARQPGPSRRLPGDVVSEIRGLLTKGFTQREVSRRTGVSRSRVAKELGRMQTGGVDEKQNLEADA